MLLLKGFQMELNWHAKEELQTKDTTVIRGVAKKFDESLHFQNIYTLIQNCS